MSSFCMLHELELGKPGGFCDKPHHSLEVKHCCQGTSLKGFLLRSRRACA